MDTQKNALLRKYHALIRKGGVSAYEKEAMLSAYGVESSRDLNVYELTELCGILDHKINPQATESDRWRKRAMAAIGAYLRNTGRADSANLIKAIACRAASCEDFNKISEGRLRDIYAEFCRKNRSIGDVDKVINEDLNELIIQN